MAKDEKALATVDPLAGMVTTERPAEDEQGGPPSHIGRDDVAMPRLALAQKTSPELETTDSRYIEGLKYTDMFHSGDRRNFGNGPILFVILRADPPHHIEFRPIDQGGGIVDRHVPNNDPRTEFRTEGGKSLPPIATKFYDFIVLILNGFDPNDPMSNVVALSFKSTGIKAAKALNNLITFRGKKPLYKGVYQLTSAADKNAKGPFAIYKIKNAGWLTEGTTAFTAAQEMWTALKDQVLNIEHDQPNDDPDSFNPADIEAGNAPADM